jgi:hypothetical protein
MQKITVNDRKTLDELYEGSAFTMVGLDPADESLAQLLEWIKGYSPVKNERFYIISGSLMNMAYGLTGDNAYPETNCTLVCMKLEDIENVNAITIPRFQIGGRWFDDVVANNARREQEKQ